MKIIDLYRERFVVSFEIFPPKTQQGEDGLKQALAELSGYQPQYISVTYGAGGSTQEKTLELALRLRDALGILPLVHFTCVGAGRDEIRRYLDEVKKNGIENILALRGDPPKGEARFTPPPDGFAYANELVSFIRSIDGFAIGVAGYPEKHLEAPSMEADLENLKRKVDAGADFIITQLFYSNEDYYRFMDRLARLGITVPVIPGIMPVTNLSQVDRVTSMCGAKVPDELIRRLDACTGGDSICEAGIEYSIKQCVELKSWGVPGLHFYTLNRAQAVKRIMDATGL
ncbi:MAG TPA: methylenetetrahydrofolate reductase [NAD(P)H] [Spirochaetota bacterium]|nr:methylenetetrahydrofolate reductase [NAD(P)H] [Spirochaetota bacterium]